MDLFFEGKSQCVQVLEGQVRWCVCAHICNSSYCNYIVSELSYIPKFSKVQISIYAEHVAPQMQSEPYIMKHGACTYQVLVKAPVLVQSDWEPVRSIYDLAINHLPTSVSA